MKTVKTLHHPGTSYLSFEFYRSLPWSHETKARSLNLDKSGEPLRERNTKKREERLEKKEKGRVKEEGKKEKEDQEGERRQKKEEGK